MANSDSLVQRILSSDQDAFTELINIYGDRVYNLAIKIARNSADAEDVFQETFTAVFEKIKTFNQQSDLFTWIYRIATNFALMKVRHGKRETVTEKDLDYYDTKIDIPTTASTIYPEQIVLNGELKTELDKALLRIPEMYRTIFILRDLENLSTAETAEILNISESNVKVRLRRARLFLRDELCFYFDRCKEKEFVNNDSE